MAGFGTSARFKNSANPTPGPGAYDPKNAVGYKVDPTSGFQGDGRFVEELKEGGEGKVPHSSPRDRKQPKDSRSYAWTAQRLAELEKEVDILKARIKEKDRLLQEKEALLKEKANVEEALDAARLQLDGGSSLSQAEIEQLKSQLLIANEKRSKLEKDILEAEGLRSEKEDEVQALEHEMIKFKELMSNQTSRMRSVNAEIDSLQEQLKLAQERSVSQQDEISKLTGQNQSLSDEMATMQSRLQTEACDLQKQLEAQKSSHVEDVNSLKMQVDAARQEVSLRAGMIEELEKKVEKLKGRLDSSREQEAKLREAGNELEQQNLQIQSALDSTTCNLEKVEAQLQEVNEKHEASQKEMSRLQKLVETAEEASLAATEKAVDMEMELTAKFNELEALREACSALKASGRDKDSQISDLEGQKAAAVARADESAAHVGALEHRVAGLEGELAKGMQARNELQEVICTRDEEIEKLQRSLADAQEAARVAVDSCEGQKSHIAQLEEHLQCAQDELSSKVEGFEQHTVTLNLKVTEAENKVAALQKELQTKAAAAAAAESSLTEAMAQIDEKAAVVAKMETCHSELSAKAAKTEMELRSQIDQMRTKHNMEIETLRAEDGAVSALKQELASMQRAVHDSQTREEEHQAEMLTVQRRLEQATAKSDQVERLQAALEQAQKRVSRAEAAAQKYKAELKRGEAVKAEMARLMEENEVLVRRTQELDADVRGLLTSNSSVLGHHNPKQKIQYHLKLKQDFEELKKECTNLLREKFHLEQCIRYLSSVGGLEVLPASAGDPSRMSQVMVPKSLAGNVVTLTPTSRNQLKWASRGKAARAADLSPYQPREDMEQAIEQVRRETAEEVEDFIKSAQDSEMLSDDVHEHNENHPLHDSSEGMSPSGSHGSPRVSPSHDGVDAKIQARILAKISAVIERRPKRKAESQQADLADQDIY